MKITLVILFIFSITLLTEAKKELLFYIEMIIIKPINELIKKLLIVWSFYA